MAELDGANGGVGPPGDRTEGTGAPREKKKFRICRRNLVLPTYAKLHYKM